jgi:hypothetical protein
MATNFWVVPLFMDSGPAGVSEMATRVGPKGFTVVVTAGEVIPPKVAVTLEVPGPTALTTPLEDTVATAGVPEVQEAVVVQSTGAPVA